jgi:hypothetical protein
MDYLQPRTDRRQALLGGVGFCAALACPPVSIAAAAGLTTERFLSTSSALCGVPLEDQDLATQILEAVLVMPGVSGSAILDLAYLVERMSGRALDDAITGADLDRAAEQIVAAWYSGMVGEPGQERVLSFTGAAAWTAIGYDASPTECAGFGAWSTAP